MKVNKKVRKLAFASALTLKAKGKAILVHDFKVENKPSTQKMLKALKALQLDNGKKISTKPNPSSSGDARYINKKVLIITEDPTVWKSVANIQKVFATRLANLTIEAIVASDIVIFSTKELQKLGGRK